MIKKLIKKLRYIRFKEYDPSWLVEASKSYIKEYPWLPDALEQCTFALEGRNYVRFVSSARANKPYSEWQFRENIWLEDTIKGDIVLDILQGNRVGGVEFYSRLFEN